MRCAPDSAILKLQVPSKILEQAVNAKHSSLFAQNCRFYEVELY
jgi:hypothetical protein